MTFLGPNLFVLGSPRAGSTSICELLTAHPDVCVSRPKETFFFEDVEEYQQGLSFYKSTYFPHYTNQQVVVDGRPQNNMLPWVIPRVKATCSGGVHFILCFRDPVERAFSQWALRVIVDLETRSFNSCIAQNLSRWNNQGNAFDSPYTENLWRAALRRSPRFTDFDYLLEAGCYAINLRRWLAVFPRKQFLIVTLDALDAATIYNFAGLNPSKGLANVPTSNSWTLRINRFNQDRTYAMIPDVATVSTLRAFYASKDADLCTLLGWDRTPWSVNQDNAG